MVNNLQIEYFLAVADNRSFTKTAEKLFVTQSAISKQISSMEKELDVVLFDRTNKNVSLTDAGRVMYDFFSEYLVRYEAAKIQARKVNEQRYGFVRLGLVLGWIMPKELIDKLKKFSVEFPNVKVSIECMSVHEQIYALINDKVDVIVTVDALVSRNRDLISWPLIDIDRVFFFSKNHRLASKKDLQIMDFRDEVFYTFRDQEDNLRTVLTDVFRNTGKVPEIISYDVLDSAVASVECGLGVVVTNPWNTLTNSNNLMGFRCGIKSRIVVATREDSLNNEARVLANELTNMFGTALDD